MSIVKINHKSKIIGTLKVISSSSTAPAYTLSRSGESTIEGFTVTYTVNTLNIAEGTSIPYVVTGILPEDLSSGSLSGDLIIDAYGSASVSFTLEDDGIPEGVENMTFYTGNLSSSISVEDTSYSNTYTLNRSTESTDEGSVVTYTINSTAAPEGTVVPYIITGISQEDLSSGSIAGDFVLDSNKQSTISLTIANDFLTEGTETITIAADGRIQTTSVTDTSTSPVCQLLLNGNGINGSSNSLITDSSSYAFPFTRTGTPTLGYDNVSKSPSVYFDGTSDYYAMPVDYAPYFQFPSGTFTVEAWVKFDNLATASGYSRVVISNYNSTTTGWTIASYQSKLRAWLTGDGIDINGTTVLSPNVWYHVALCGSAGSYKLFLNGVQEGNTYTGVTKLNGGAVGVGASVGRAGYVGVNPLQGYIKGIRVVDGSNLYTQNFAQSLPTTPFEAIGNTVLLVNPSPNIIDSSSKNDLLITEGGVAISTGNFKYGTGSLYFDGTGDAIRVPATPDLTLGAGDFTVEFWCNFTLVGNNNLRGIICQGADSSYSSLASYQTAVWANRWKIVIDYTTVNTGNAVGGIAFYQYKTTGCKTVVAVNDGQWHHIAFTRSSGVLRCFLDGVLKSTVNNTSDFNDTTTRYTIGRRGADHTNGMLGYYTGFLDDFRIVKGSALYTQNFTPPTQGLTA